jgi:succinyl-CoA synthetase beta subunit
MDLLEYQAKKLFNEVEIPILPSQTIHDSGELKRLQIPYPVVLKSQVRSGGRGRAGGIRFVENTIDAIAAARAIFNLPILGEYPEVILAEARYDAQQEFFLALLLDYQLQRPVLLGSVKGGMDVENLLEHMQKVVIDDQFSPFYARRLAKKMGMDEKLLESVSTIIEKMYNLFMEKDLDLVEINPLGVSAEGEVMALDGKITANDHALKRHPNLISLLTSTKSLSEYLSEDTEVTSSPIDTLNWIDKIEHQGQIGIISNSLGLALSTWDLIINDKIKAAGCLILEENHYNLSLTQQLEMGLEQMTKLPNLKVILINIISYPQATEQIAALLSNYFQPQLKNPLIKTSEERTPRPTGSVSTNRKRSSKTRSPSKHIHYPQWVIRLADGDITALKESLSVLDIHWVDSLEQSVTQTLSILKFK